MVWWVGVWICCFTLVGIGLLMLVIVFCDWLIVFVIDCFDVFSLVASLILFRFDSRVVLLLMLVDFC